ncbi:MAG: 4-alpha-glucanotransferase [Treponema sp.]|nr:4-alpha-glucanotransferase [Treponema sp.]
MNLHRQSGILLHPTSLSGTPGIGTIGKAAYEFVDWLEKGHQTLWQILPLGPTGYGDSPYASFSTFAGNPLLIDLALLVQNGRADEKDMVPPAGMTTAGAIDYGAVVHWKLSALTRCAAYFLTHGSARDRAAYEAFKQDNADWLTTYADFMSIKQHYDAVAMRQGTGGARLWNVLWPEALATCDAAAVAAWESEHGEDIEQIKVVQFFFDDQWRALKSYANAKGISIIGDIPIFVAPDSADVWSCQKLFQLDARGMPCVVAGVPPDYFSATGQLWGNPLYNWDAMKADGYDWWIRRIRRTLKLTDCVRIDHFRGFESYWAIPAGSPTAVNGTWQPGPGIDLFFAIRAALGDIPVIAEDLGVITDGVRQLRDDTGFPGMKVLQFAFDPDEAGKDGMTNAFLPHTYPHRCVVYTGTHDNDTLQGWLNAAPDSAVRIAAEYATGRSLSAAEARALSDDGTVCAGLIRAALASVADYAVIPLQDVLALGTEARMNTPNTIGGNWAWRVPPGALTDSHAAQLAFLSDLYGRGGQRSLVQF